MTLLVRTRVHTRKKGSSVCGSIISEHTEVRRCYHKVNPQVHRYLCTCTKLLDPRSLRSIHFVIERFRCLAAAACCFSRPRPLSCFTRTMMP